jgi:subtilisin family serine protease
MADTPPEVSHLRDVLLSSTIAMPLRQQLIDEKNRLDLLAAEPAGGVGQLSSEVALPPKLFHVIIDLNLEYPGGRTEARDWIIGKLRELAPGFTGDQNPKNKYNQQYFFAELEAQTVLALVAADQGQHKGVPAADSTMSKGPRAIHHVWADFEITAQMNKSISTIKGDAAHASYGAYGEGIVWAVMDSGIDATHPHFEVEGNLNVDKPLEHTDFTGAPPAADGQLPTALTDGMGHGTHVAGIIGGRWGKDTPPRAYNRSRSEMGEVTYVPVNTTKMSGMASRCKMLSLKVMDANGKGNVSNLIAAITLIQELNGYGRRLLVHGVNMSVGYSFDPEWFACGQSPLCVEVDRLVKSGVVVVVAAGNTGYGVAQSRFNGVVSAGMGLTINDPGNAEMAITVGSTHRDMPHVYGVSYFSSKGPTGDGRAKPDLVAPGEKILSCAAGKSRQDMAAQTPPLDCDYVEDSGTSMAAPHVSGAIAAFLSIRREFIGRPGQVKELFTSTATDLKREKYFQGSGLVDLMRAIQAV